eukprot:11259858-Ditylum_brightwellii.AAC.1
MSLCAAVADPVEAHVDGSGLVLAHCGVDNPTSAGVICHDQGGRLGVPHFGEGESQLFALSCVGEEGPNFCLSSECHYLSHDFAHAVHWP